MMSGESKVLEWIYRASLMLAVVSATLVVAFCAASPFLGSQVYSVSGAQRVELSTPEIPADSTSVVLNGDDISCETIYSGLLVGAGRSEVEVYVDGEKVFGVNDTPFVAQIGATPLCLVNLSGMESWDELEVHITGLDGATPQLNTFIVGDYDACVSYLFENSWFVIAACAVFIVLVVVLLAAHLMTHRTRRGDMRMLCLAGFMLVASLWVICDSYPVLLLPVRVEWLAYLDYVAFAFLPVPMIEFVRALVSRYGRLLKAMGIVCCINALAQIAISALGVVSIDRMIGLTYAALFVSVGTSVYTIVRYRHESHEATLLLVSYVALLVPFAVGLVLYLCFGSKVYRVLFVLGLTLQFIGFAYTFGASALRSQVSLREDALRYRHLMNLQERDELTGLYNAQVFERDLERTVEQVASGKCREAALVMFNINGLKRLNNSFGQTAGDDVLVSTANALLVAKDANANVYRIGGDTFAIIMVDPQTSWKELQGILDERYDAERAKFGRGLEPLSRGIASIHDADGTVMLAGPWRRACMRELYHDKRKRRVAANYELDEQLQHLVDTVIATIDARDSYTAGHSSRVADLSAIIADELGLSEDSAREIILAARMHDVGKIMTPDAVLLKEGPLTNEEFDVIKLHPAVGARIVNRAPGLYAVSRIVLYHHERYDGKGYPRGLSGDDIPLGARVVALADSIDAMTSKRCYRDALTLAQCREEIEKNLGKMYDPAIGDVVLAEWERIEACVMGVGPTAGLQ